MNVLSSRRLRDNCWLLLMPFDIIMKRHWVSWEEGKLRLPIRPVTKGAKMVLIRTQCFWSIIYDLFLFMTNHLPSLALRPLDYSINSYWINYRISFLVIFILLNNFLKKLFYCYSNKILGYLTIYSLILFLIIWINWM